MDLFNNSGVYLILLQQFEMSLQVYMTFIYLYNLHNNLQKCLRLSVIIWNGMMKISRTKKLMKYKLNNYLFSTIFWFITKKLKHTKNYANEDEWNLWNGYMYFVFIYIYIYIYIYYYEMNDKITSDQSVNGLKDQIEFADNIWHENYISFISFFLFFHEKSSFFKDDRYLSSHFRST